MCVCLYVCVPLCMGACRSQKRTSNTALESELEAVCKQPDVGAETELGSSGRAASAPNLGAITLALGGLAKRLFGSVFHEHALGARQRGVLRSPSNHISKLQSAAPNPQQRSSHICPDQPGATKALPCGLASLWVKDCPLVVPASTSLLRSFIDLKEKRKSFWDHWEKANQTRLPAGSSVCK